ncbi:hypothetical protein [Streptomyces sp. NBC_00091]|uniref:hypothetical protein n=1 Tax=Streptomyces sp. NBC_00091 TaxID=2975648 RepID=UPI0022597A58|nr:hypothetical protein [Streptomyces sp. NBC_00091]MCX5380808.1 hypothetical protein [Streptomyces sp. NBC_00091]
MSHPHARPLRPGLPWSGALLLATLSTLLFAVLSCPSHGHTDVSYGSSAAGASLHPGPTPPAGPTGHPHPHPDHGSSCASSDLAPSAQGPSPLPTGPARPAAGTGATPEAAPAAPPGAAGPAIDRSGRSTLTIVCRWRL